MSPSYHSKVSSTQNQGVPFFCCLVHGAYFYISMFGYSQGFSDNSSLPILVDVQRLHENSKLILCVSNRDKWLNVHL